MLTVRAVAEALEEIFPRRYAFSDDNTGLQLGSFRQRVGRILVALDPDEEAVSAASRRRCDLIVTHHPIWLRPPRTLLAERPVARGPLAAAAGRIAILSAHTNADFAPGGLCDLLAKGLGLGETRAIETSGEAMVGRVGDLPSPIAWPKYLTLLRRRFGRALRFAGTPPALLSRVAACSGSGADLLEPAFAAGADVLVTGDVKYHAARDAETLGRLRRAERGRGAGFVLVDAGHFATERPFVTLAAARLKKVLPRTRIITHRGKEPFRTP